MNLSDILWKRKKEKNSALYMPYLTLGDPSFLDSVEFAKNMIKAGADVLELGIPFSDPTADGPVIQKAMIRAMNNAKFEFESIFETTHTIHSIHPDLPLVYLTYFNPVYQYQKEKNRIPGESFLKKCVEVGIRGLVIPDLPLDSPEAQIIIDYIRRNNLPISFIPMIAPNTSLKRMKFILSNGSGFVYYISSLGVTGLRESLPANIKDKARKIRNYSDIPVFAGFGINRIEQIETLKYDFDGIIVGSLNHKIIEEYMIKEKNQKLAQEKIYEITKNFVDHLVLV